MGSSHTRVDLILKNYLDYLHFVWKATHLKCFNSYSLLTHRCLQKILQCCTNRFNAIMLKYIFRLTSLDLVTLAILRLRQGDLTQTEHLLKRIPNVINVILYSSSNWVFQMLDRYKSQKLWIFFENLYLNSLWSVQNYRIVRFYFILFMFLFQTFYSDKYHPQVLYRSKTVLTYYSDEC